VSGSLRPARLIIAIAAALLVAYAVIWTQVSSFDIGRSDFTAFYVGGTLLREGHTGDLYSQALQQPLHSALIAPERRIFPSSTHRLPRRWCCRQRSCRWTLRTGSGRCSNSRC
jgi:hypothetical protein